MPNVKVIRIDGAQAARFWPVLVKGFGKALPPGAVGGKVVENNLLQSILNRSMDCWVMKADREEGEVMVAAALTTIRTDPITSQRALHIYSLFSEGDVTDEEWEQAFGILSRAAGSSRCHLISAFTDNPRIKSIVERLGGKASWSFVELEAKHV